MSEGKQKKLSVITITIIFLLLVLMTIIIARRLGISEILAYTDSMQINTINSVQDSTNAKASNQVLIKTIKKEYGIDIIYGEDTRNIANKIEATVQQDEYIINNNIKNIYSSLKSYPTQILNIFKSKKFTLEIVIVDKFTNNNLALASKNSLNEVRIYISNTDKFERAFHHELFHILEYYMTDKNKDIFSNWSYLNPVDFKYNDDVLDLNSEYVYAKEEEIKSETYESYFITKYSKTSEKEDRAEIFTEFMIMKKLPSCFSRDTYIRKKLDYILEEVGINISGAKFNSIKLLN